MREHFLSCSAAALLATSALVTPASAAPWARGYVVTAYEPAWYYGGSVSFHKGNAQEPGSDCPNGSYPGIDYEHVFLTPWRDAKAAENINHPPNTELAVVENIHIDALTYRGFRDGIDTYINPFAAPDPGIQPVTGKIAEGFDLDNNSRTGGFTSPDGQQGIDNAYYRAWGCINAFRGAPWHAPMSMRANDKMVEGLYTFVIRVSGNKDPRNDEDSTVEIGFSPDHMVKSPHDDLLPDWSYRIAKNNDEYSRVKATIRNGVVETQPTEELHAPRFSWFANQFGDADFHKGRLRLVMDSTGNASGLIGGYRDWRDLWAEDHFAQNGAISEQRDHQNSMAMYYAIKRYADGMPDPKTGRNMGISIAYRLQAIPAFVVDSIAPTPSTVAMTADIERQAFLYKEHREAFYKAVGTREIQPLPPGSEEGVRPLVHLPDGSWKLVAPFLAPRASDPLYEDEPPLHKFPYPKKKGQQQVRNTAPSTIALSATR